MKNQKDKLFYFIKTFLLNKNKNLKSRFQDILYKKEKNE